MNKVSRRCRRNIALAEESDGIERLHSPFFIMGFPLVFTVPTVSSGEWETMGCRFTSGFRWTLLSLQNQFKCLEGELPKRHASPNTQ